MNIKINLKDKRPPGTVFFHYAGLKDLIVYISRSCKEPCEENNDDKFSNVNTNFIKLSDFSLIKYQYQE